MATPPNRRRPSSSSRRRGPPPKSKQPKQGVWYGVVGPSGLLAVREAKQNRREAQAALGTANKALRDACEEAHRRVASTRLLAHVPGVCHQAVQRRWLPQSPKTPKISDADSPKAWNLSHTRRKIGEQNHGVADNSSIPRCGSLPMARAAALPGSGRAHHTVGFGSVGMDGHLVSQVPSANSESKSSLHRVGQPRNRRGTTHPPSPGPCRG